MSAFPNDNRTSGELVQIVGPSHDSSGNAFSSSSAAQADHQPRDPMLMMLNPPEQDTTPPFQINQHQKAEQGEDGVSESRPQQQVTVMGGNAQFTVRGAQQPQHRMPSFVQMGHDSTVSTGSGVMMNPHRVPQGATAGALLRGQGSSTVAAGNANAFSTTSSTAMPVQGTEVAVRDSFDEFEEIELPTSTSLFQCVEYPSCSAYEGRPSVWTRPFYFDPTQWFSTSSICGPRHNFFAWYQSQSVEDEFVFFYYRDRSVTITASFAFIAIAIVWLILALYKDSADGMVIGAVVLGVVTLMIIYIVATCLGKRLETYEKRQRKVMETTGCVSEAQYLHSTSDAERNMLRLNAKVHEMLGILVHIIAIIVTGAYAAHRSECSEFEPHEYERTCLSRYASDGAPLFVFMLWSQSRPARFPLLGFALILSCAFLLGVRFSPLQFGINMNQFYVTLVSYITFCLAVAYGARIREIAIRNSFETFAQLKASQAQLFQLRRQLEIVSQQSKSSAADKSPSATPSGAALPPPPPSVQEFLQNTTQQVFLVAVHWQNYLKWSSALTQDANDIAGVRSQLEQSIDQAIEVSIQSASPSPVVAGSAIRLGWMSPSTILIAFPYTPSQTEGETPSVFLFAALASRLALNQSSSIPSPIIRVLVHLCDVHLITSNEDGAHQSCGDRLLVKGDAVDAIRQMVPPTSASSQPISVSSTSSTVLELQTLAVNNEKIKTYFEETAAPQPVQLSSAFLQFAHSAFDKNNASVKTVPMISSNETANTEDSMMASNVSVQQQDSGAARNPLLNKGQKTANDNNNSGEIIVIDVLLEGHFLAQFHVDATAGACSTAVPVPQQQPKAAVANEHLALPSSEQQQNGKKNKSTSQQSQQTPLQAAVEEQDTLLTVPYNPCCSRCPRFEDPAIEAEFHVWSRHPYQLGHVFATYAIQLAASFTIIIAHHAIDEFPTSDSGSFWAPYKWQVAAVVLPSAFIIIHVIVGERVPRILVTLELLVHYLLYCISVFAAAEGTIVGNATGIYYLSLHIIAQNRQRWYNMWIHWLMHTAFLLGYFFWFLTHAESVTDFTTVSLLILILYSWIGTLRSGLMLDSNLREAFMWTVVLRRFHARIVTEKLVLTQSLLVAPPSVTQLDGVTVFPSTTANKSPSTFEPILNILANPNAPLQLQSMIQPQPVFLSPTSLSFFRSSKKAATTSNSGVSLMRSASIPRFVFYVEDTTLSANRQESLVNVLSAHSKENNTTATTFILLPLDSPSKWLILCASENEDDDVSAVSQVRSLTKMLLEMFATTQTKGDQPKWKLVMTYQNTVLTFAMSSGNAAPTSLNLLGAGVSFAMAIGQSSEVTNLLSAQLAQGNYCAVATMDAAPILLGDGSLVSLVEKVSCENATEDLYVLKC